MIHKLKRKLVLIYGVTTSVVLMIILFVLYSMSRQQSKNYRLQTFEQAINVVSREVETSINITSTWVTKMQQEYGVYIYLQEYDVVYHNVMNLQLTRNYEHLINDIKQRVKTEGMDLDEPLKKKYIQQSAIYELNASYMHKIYASAVTIPKGESCISVIMIERNKQSEQRDVLQIVFYCVIGVLGSIALFSISILFIGKVLRPVEISQKQQVDFIAAASHELRSPMTVIKAGLATIQEEPQQLDTFMPAIQNECERMTHLIQDLLTLATSDAKRWSMNQEKIDMDTFMIELYDTFCCLQKEKGSPIELDTGEEILKKVQGDRERLRQVITILVDNGWSYTSKEKGMKLRAYNQKHHVVIEVIDYGIGISDEQKEKVFDRFFQGEQSRNDKKHYGLGLSIAKEIITLHNGVIDIKDTEGGGATFCITLPVCK